MPYSDPQNPEVISLPLSKIMPDRYQARLAIPPELKDQFFSGKIDCYDVARHLLDLAEEDAGVQHLVNELRLLGQSILNERQIEPATGIWVDTAGGLVVILETGERRFWSLAIEAVVRRMREEPQLRISVEPGASRQRQVAENFLREDLCAVEMGKAVATMILESQDIYPEDNEAEMAYYRRALQTNRLRSGTWPEIERITGYSRTVLYRHLRLLALDDELLYLSTLYRLPEGALRDIVLQPKEKQKDLVIQAIQERWGEIVEGGAGGNGRRSKKKAAAPAAGVEEARRRLADRVTALLGPLTKQSRADGNLDEVALELASRLDREAARAAARMFETLAVQLHKASDRRAA
jgi:hypothetical protein